MVESPKLEGTTWEGVASDAIPTTTTGVSGVAAQDQSRLGTELWFDGEARRSDEFAVPDEKSFSGGGREAPVARQEVRADPESDALADLQSTLMMTVTPRILIEEGQELYRDSPKGMISIHLHFLVPMVP